LTYHIGSVNVHRTENKHQTIYVLKINIERRIMARKSKLSQLMSRVRAGKVTKADRKALRAHAARARRARK